jgi:aminopeptidase N
MPANAGIQKPGKILDSGLRRMTTKLAIVQFLDFEIGSSKEGSVMRVLRKQMGAPAARTAIRQYPEKHIPGA